MSPIYVWQRIISPHMAGLAAALAEQGRELVYVAERPMSDERARQGWAAPALGAARLELVPSAEAVRTLIDAAPSNSIHLCQGIRSNGLVGIAQRELARRGLSQWVIMETVDNEGVQGLLKRPVYTILFWRWRRNLTGVLATGLRTPDWVVARGMPKKRVFPFAYFLPDRAFAPVAGSNESGLYRIVFAGQLIARKRVDLLIAAVAKIEPRDVELVVIGSGPLEPQLRAQADALIPGRVHWMGRLPMEAVPQELAKADCLVLPSRHDGWGAVVSEALMVGTPAVCSEACGSSEVVLASGVGGVFPSGEGRALTALFVQMVEQGRASIEDRRELANWATALGARAGARYLLSVLDHVEGRGGRPVPPWRAVNPPRQDVAPASAS
jgi:glycosyltransferase involved in cell wall biosynthesis